MKKKYTEKEICIENVDDVAFLMVYFNFNKNPWIKRRFIETYDRLSLLTHNVFALEISYDGKYDIAPIRKIDSVLAKSFLWHKENGLNWLINKLPPNIKKVAWVDGDIEFIGDSIVSKISTTLDEYPLAQIGSSFVFLNADESIDFVMVSAAEAIVNRLPRYDDFSKYHCGLAWCATLDFLKKIKLMPEMCIIGNGDSAIALGAVEYALSPDRPAGFHSLQYDWRKSHCENINKQYSDCFMISVNDVIDALRGTSGLGCIHCPVIHYFHGHMKNRNYVERIEKLRGVDMSSFIKDENGILYTTDKNFTDGFMNYMSVKDKI